MRESDVRCGISGLPRASVHRRHRRGGQLVHEQGLTLMVGSARPRRPLFPLGQFVATPGALDALLRSGESLTKFLERHVVGDWGDVCDSDKRLNDRAVVEGERLLSSYQTT